MRKLITFAGYLAGVLVVSLVFGDQLGHLTISLGVAAAGVAFALQEVIASVAGWIAISLGQFYRIGDRVQLGGIMGDVIDIAVLRTTLMECGEWVRSDLYNGRIVRISNGFVFKEPVLNYSGGFPFLWDEITVPVKYGSDRRLAREILHNIAGEVTGDHPVQAREAWQQVVERYRVEDEPVEPRVTLVANDNWMEFTVRYVVAYRQRRAIKDQLFSRILEAFDEAEGQVALASMTLQIVDPPLLDVRVSERTRSPSL